MRTPGSTVVAAVAAAAVARRKQEETTRTLDSVPGHRVAGTNQADRLDRLKAQQLQQCQAPLALSTQDNWRERK